MNQRTAGVIGDMERSSGPVGTATQTTGKSSLDGSIAGRANLSSTVRRAPVTVAQHGNALSTSSTQMPTSTSHVLSLAREAMRNALEENRTKAAEASGVSNELKPGVTIDLSHKNIHKFPEEVVDIIKVELER